ncbi:MAG: DUF5719 family protein [Propionibacteriaceae bacterium]|jgi:hypothetical protein|nr:DUF5719 family protein [Propionibacteriaceae bacterium]
MSQTPSSTNPWVDSSRAADTTVSEAAASEVPPLEDHHTYDASTRLDQPSAKERRNRWLARGAQGVIALLAAGGIVAALSTPAPVIEPTTVLASGERLLGCVVGDPTLGDVTVQATGIEPVTIWQLGQPPSEPAIRASVTNPASAVVVSGGQSVGGIVQAVQGGQAMASLCSSPISSGWWNGVPVTADQFSTLVLTNVDDSQATVDVSLYGETGLISVAALNNTQISGQSTVSFSLNDRVISETPIAVEVRATVGRVVATLRTYGAQGSDWQAPLEQTSTDLVIPGIPGGAGSRVLTITNTSERQTQVAVEALGAFENFVPVGAAAIDVGPLDTISLELGPALRQEALGLRLTSDQPVSASLVSVTTDIAGVSAQPAFTGGIVLPSLNGILALTNPDEEPAAVTITRLDPAGVPIDEVIVEVPRGSVEHVLEQFDGSILITTSADSLRAALLFTDGGLSIVPLGSGGAVSTLVTMEHDPSLG